MNIKIEDIPYDLHLMVEIIGEKKFLEICNLYGGSAVYIPMPKRIMLGERNRQMAKEFNGRNFEELSLRYGISKQQVKRVLREKDVM